MTGHVRGWNIGARVNCYVDDDGNDCVEVRVTGGSNSRWDGKTIGTFYRTKKGQLRRKK